MTNFFTELHEWLTDEIYLYIKAISLPLILGAVYKFGKFFFQKFRAFKTSRSLFPYYTDRQIEETQKKYIRTKCQNIDPANEVSLKQSFAFATREDLLNFFLKKVFKVNENENRFYLILADSGMGKTTFLLSLYMRFNSIFYINFHKKKIKLLPLGESFETTSSNIKSITDPHKTILLLDGFDELPTFDNANIKNKFNEIFELVKDFSTVLISCRTHFFSSENEEPYELNIKKFNTNGNGYHTIKKIYISPFDESDIKKYINKTFPFYEISNKRRAIEAVHKTNDLMARPMLLSYIKDIITLNDTYLTTNFDIYESLIYNWIQREANKYPLDKLLEFKLNLVYFSYAVSDYIYKNYERNGLYIPIEEAQKISASYSIDLNEIEIKSRSLLNRNSKGDYKFSHKSIYEFFLAYIGYTTRVVNFEKNKIKYNLENYDVAKNFIEEIVDSKRQKFLLPKMYHKFDNINSDLYQKILNVRNKDTTVIWESGNTFRISKIPAANIDITK